MRILRDLGEAAVEYGRNGLHVIPCRPLGKAPLIADWPNRASIDEVTIARWWFTWPDANIGLLTGVRGVDVLDIDVREEGNGFPVLERVREAGLLAVAHRLVLTPSGGQHWYFRGTSQRKAKLAGRYVDFQASGGYVLAPPSKLTLGSEVVQYKTAWRRDDLNGTLPWRKVVAAVAPAPGGAEDKSRRLTSVARPRRERRSSRGALLSAREGSRNQALFRAACEYVRRGRDPYLLAADAVSLGLPDNEVRATIASAVRTVTPAHRG